MEWIEKCNKSGESGLHINKRSRLKRPVPEAPGEMANVIEAAKKANIRDKITVMIGGAPITDSYCKAIGADIYTPDCATAAEEAYKVSVGA